MLQDQEEQQQHRHHHHSHPHTKHGRNNNKKLLPFYDILISGFLFAFYNMADVSQIIENYCWDFRFGLLCFALLKIASILERVIKIHGFLTRQLGFYFIFVPNSKKSVKRKFKIIVINYLSFFPHLINIYLFQTFNPFYFQKTFFILKSFIFLKRVKKGTNFQLLFFTFFCSRFWINLFGLSDNYQLSGCLLLQVPSNFRLLFLET